MLSYYSIKTIKKSKAFKINLWIEIFYSFLYFQKIILHFIAIISSAHKFTQFLINFLQFIFTELNIFDFKNSKTTSVGHKYFIMKTSMIIFIHSQKKSCTSVTSASWRKENFSFLSFFAAIIASRHKARAELWIFFSSALNV